MSSAPEPVPTDALDLLAAREDGPMLMLNLLEFHPGGEEIFAEYGRRVRPFIERAGGRQVVAAKPRQTMVGEGNWDLVLIVEYDTHRKLVEVMADPEYQEVLKLRTQAVKRSELRAMDPWPNWR